MKKTLSLLTLLGFLISAYTSNAQEIINEAPDYNHQLELSVLVGYQLNGSMNFVQGDLRLKDNVNYNFALAVNTGYGTFAEVSYTFCQSEASFRSFSWGYENQNFDVDIHYIQIGGIKEFMDERVRPYGTFSLGASGFVPKSSGFQDVNYDSWWQFAINFGLGVKVSLSEKIALRAQARLMMPLYLSGVGIFCGSSGCGGGLTTSSNIIQGDFSGGLVIGL